MKFITLLSSTLFITVAFIASSCGNNSASGTQNKDSLSMMTDASRFTTVSFPDSIQNFGTVVKGKKVNIVFHVKNTGTKPLIIADARPSCGCTVADFTRSAIAPGGVGEVTGTFDSNHGMPGDIRKTITVSTNTSPMQNMMIFTGQVVAKQDSTTASK